MYNNDDGLFLVSGFLNGESNDYAGGFNNLAGIPGQLGKIASYNHALALKLSKASIGTLYGGLYQVIRSKAASTAAPARGLLCFWDDYDDYVVTPDASLALDGKIAGVYVSAPDKGDYTVIQVGGLASVKFRATVTDKTDGNIVLGLTADNVADAIADGTGSYISGGAKGLKSIIGVAYEAPVDASITRVWLKNIALNI